MADTSDKAMLLHYLQRSREAVVWKLEGLSEYDVRRPMTPTGTNLLGLIKHLASCEFGYLGDTFGRPHNESLPWWDDDAETNADMWATADETRADIVALYHRSWVHGDATVAALGLDAVGQVPWWSEGRRAATLHRILVHMIDETSRHAGQADILRESIDGAAGLDSGKTSLPDERGQWWVDYVQRLERTAQDAAHPAPS